MAMNPGPHTCWVNHFIIESQTQPTVILLLFSFMISFISWNALFFLPDSYFKICLIYNPHAKVSPDLGSQLFTPLFNPLPYAYLNMALLTLYLTILHIWLVHYILKITIARLSLFISHVSTWEYVEQIYLLWVPYSTQNNSIPIVKLRCWDGTILD